MKDEREKKPKSEVKKPKVLELEIEELEPIVAPRLASNSNETLVVDEE
jgi:hypothetical protein